MNLTYKTQNNTVRAFDSDMPIGKVSVQDIDFHWANGTYIPMAGIGGVGTDEAYRGLGIAGKMMAAAETFAVENGYACSGLTTNLGNNARRLYARAGYTLIFRPGRYIKTRHPIQSADVSDIILRPYCEGDEHTFLRHFESQHLTYFGYRARTSKSWRELRAQYLTEEPNAFQVAEADGHVLGWTGLFRKWVGVCSEIWTVPDRGRAAIAQTLLNHLEKHHLTHDRPNCHIWASPQDPFMQSFLTGNGYTFQESRVFMLHIIDLPKLLHQLSALFQNRLAKSSWTGALKFTTPDHHAVLHIDDPITVSTDNTADIEIQTDTSTLCRLLAGALHPRDAYLENLLSVAPHYTEQIDTLLADLFPPLRHIHPADDLW
ncbi:MAG: putative acetyltransferase [Candidatus Latescibacterota bacterium]|jgi:predicted acetyltransferase